MEAHGTLELSTHGKAVNHRPSARLPMRWATVEEIGFRVDRCNEADAIFLPILEAGGAYSASSLLTGGATTPTRQEAGGEKEHASLARHGRTCTMQQRTPPFPAHAKEEKTKERTTADFRRLYSIDKQKLERQTAAVRVCMCEILRC